MRTDDDSRGPWRGQSCLPCRDSSRHFNADARDTSFQPRNVATTGDAAGRTARATQANREPEAL